jgi:hypothetical protein
MDEPKEGSKNLKTKKIEFKKVEKGRLSLGPPIHLGPSRLCSLGPPTHLTPSYSTLFRTSTHVGPCASTLFKTSTHIHPSPILP